MTATRTVQKNVEFILTQKELADLGGQLAITEGQILDLEEQKAAAKRQFKSQLVLLAQRKALISHVIRRGRQTRDVDVAEVMDYENKTVRYLFGPTLVESRPMTDEEAQLLIPGTDSAVAHDGL